MMQPFEFSNNALSLMCSVFSVVVGMAFPLLLQAIQRIEEQYVSSRIAKMLTSEPKFKCFQWNVAVSIVLAFASLFVLQLVEGNDFLVIAWVSVQTLFSLSLLVSMIALFYLMLTYYHADDLLEHINSMINDERE